MLLLSVIYLSKRRQNPQLTVLKLNLTDMLLFCFLYRYWNNIWSIIILAKIILIKIWLCDIPSLAVNTLKKQLPVGKHQLLHRSPPLWRTACWKMQMSSATSLPGPGTPRSPACKTAMKQKDGIRNKEQGKRQDFTENHIPFIWITHSLCHYCVNY